jgi:hypothetical protein
MTSLYYLWPRYIAPVTWLTDAPSLEGPSRLVVDLSIKFGVFIYQPTDRATQDSSWFKRHFITDLTWLKILEVVVVHVEYLFLWTFFGAALGIAFKRLCCRCDYLLHKNRKEKQCTNLSWYDGLLVSWSTTFFGIIRSIGLILLKTSIPPAGHRL